MLLLPFPSQKHTMSLRSSIIPFPNPAKAHYTPIQPPKAYREGTIYVCIASTATTPNAPDNSTPLHKLFIIKAFRPQFQREDEQIFLLQQLKEAQALNNSNHISNKYFPTLHHIADPLWQSMDAIRGCELAQLFPLIRENIPFGAIFTCHLFHELCTVMTGLREMGLVYTDVTSKNIMFQYKDIPRAEYELPGLVLVDVDFEAAEDGIDASARSILNICKCKTIFERLLDFEATLRVGEEDEEEEVMAKTPITDVSSTSLVDIIDIGIINRLDECIQEPEDYRFNLQELVAQFCRVTERVAANGYLLGDQWPTEELNKLLGIALVSETEIEEALADNR